MTKSKVYYSNLRTKAGSNLLQKLEKLLVKAGIGEIDFKNKYAAIKLHFGEAGNLAYLRPNYAKVVADTVRRLGGTPFLTDCNTLYVGGRKNALDHLQTAYENGYNPFTTGCHILIGDGLKGTDEVEVPVVGGDYVKNAKIGRAVMDADVVISLTHFKGHELTGFGGALKNLGMGCGSRAGKMEMHNAGKPTVNQELCIGCGKCTLQCAHGAVAVDHGLKKADIDKAKCVGCGRCLGACPTDAIYTDCDEANDILDCKMVEYAKAVLDGRPHFHISLVIDVSPFCDCHEENDLAIVPDVGMFASFDPVALDAACADAVLRQPMIHGSYLAEMEQSHGDHFTNTSPETNWKIQLEHGEKLGLGSMTYELIEI